MNRRFFKFSIVCSLALAFLICFGAFSVSADETHDKNYRYCTDVQSYINELLGDPEFQDDVKEAVRPILSKLNEINMGDLDDEATYFKIALYEHQAKALYNLATIYYGQTDEIVKASAKEIFDELCKAINELQPLDAEFDYNTKLFGAYVAPADGELVNPESGYCATLQYAIACKKLDLLLEGDEFGENGVDAKHENLLKIVEDAKTDLLKLSGEENVGCKSKVYEDKVTETKAALKLRHEKNTAINLLNAEYKSIVESNGDKIEFKNIYDEYVALIEEPGEASIGDILNNAIFDLKEAKFIDDHYDAYTIDVGKLDSEDVSEALDKIKAALNDLDNGGEAFEEVRQHFIAKIKSIAANELSKLMEKVVNSSSTSTDDPDYRLQEHILKSVKQADDLTVDKVESILSLIGEHVAVCKNWYSIDTQKAFVSTTQEAFDLIMSSDGESYRIASEAALELYVLGSFIERNNDCPDIEAAVEIIRNKALNLDKKLSKEEHKLAMSEAREQLNVLFELQDKKNEAYEFIDSLSNYTDEEKNALKKRVDDALADAISKICDESQDKIDVDLIKNSAMSNIGSIETNASADNFAKIKNNALTSLDAEKKKLDALLEEAMYLSKGDKEEIKAKADAEYKKALDAITASSDANEVERLAQSTIAALKLKQDEVKSLNEDACISIFVPITVALAVFGLFEAAALALILRRKKRDAVGEKHSAEVAETETSACGAVVALAVTGLEITMWSLTSALAVADIVLAVLIVYFAFIKQKKVEKVAVEAVQPEDAVENLEDEQNDEPLEENETLDLGAFLIDIEKKASIKVDEQIEEVEEVEEVEEPEVLEEIEDECEIEESEDIETEEVELVVEEEQEEEQEIEPEPEKVPEIDVSPVPTVTVNIPKNKVRQAIVNIDQLEKYFEAGERVDVDILKEKKLIPTRSGCIKVLGRGRLHKPLVVVAREFSSTAQKMIIEAGGEAKMDATEVIINY